MRKMWIRFTTDEQQVGGIIADLAGKVEHLDFGVVEEVPYNKNKAPAVEKALALKKVKRIKRVKAKNGRKARRVRGPDSTLVPKALRAKRPIPLKDVLLGYLQTAGATVTVKELNKEAANYGFPVRSVSPVIFKLKEQGLIKTVERGIYALTGSATI